MEALPVETEERRGLPLLSRFFGGASSSTSASPTPSSAVSLRWRPCRHDEGPWLVVTKGDLTTARVDAIVNAANSDLIHCGGVAAAIAKRGGKEIEDDSRAWIKANEHLPVGQAMSTRAGKLPCRHVIHVVGPSIGGSGFFLPTVEQAQLLRDAVHNALCEAERLRLTSIAMPGISSGVFGYPTELAAADIVGECVRYALEKASTTTLKTIVFMNIDHPKCQSFATALRDAADSSGRGEMPEQVVGMLMESGNAEVQPKTATPVVLHDQRSPPSARIAVMPVRVGENDYEVLLGVERMPSGGTYQQRCLTVICGNDAKGKRKGDATQAACRLLSDRLGCVVPMEDIRQAIQEAGRPMGLDSIKTTLHLPYLGDDQSQDLSRAFERWKMKAWFSVDAPDHLVWVPWQRVKAATTAGSASKTLSRGWEKEMLRTPFGSFRPSPVLGEMAKKFAVDVERQLESLMLGWTIKHEIHRVASLQTLPESELIAKILGRDWKLRLTSPPLPPPSPFDLLPPDDSDYKRTLAELPSDLASRVVSVRRVRASARRGEYENTKRRIEDGRVKEMEPLYHGTPERWRATAIALNGFDVSIRLNGRSHGDGVYTSADVSTAIRFTNPKGSLLRLRGLVVSDCTSGGHNTIVHGPVHIFPNPKALLPLIIADYAAEDEQDRVETQRRQIQEEYHREQERREAIQETMAVEETEFEQNMGRRLQSALGVYSTSLRKIRSAMDDVRGKERTPSQRFFQERRHFAQCLPMYEVKADLVRVLRENAIVIVVADTGSGKSTQLPQILLDEVVPESEPRRIAILEPRRVNAISLSKRVSEERGTAPGQEVGYTIGRGDSNVTPRVTRLEYMTHGLFVQMARDPAYLRRTYCAVIVDEAHERSVDVDLSLALLRRLLKQLSSDATAPFKVVVTSATIEDEAEKFQRYLDPSLHRSTIFRVSGRVFPVHVEHRGDMQVDRKALGTASVGKVMTSAAIQSAVELLRTTEQGNILVFLPGEGSINEALAVARNEIMTSATVEVLDTYGSGPSAFCFRMSIRSDRPAGRRDQQGERKTTKTQEEWYSERAERRIVTTYVVGFHGKITRAERDRVLNPRASNSRLVVFTTNIAETGVTIPNVRYVIDTGLERRVRWNATLDMNEMVTEPISKSSMIQRAGRAGRTASGICVRLFPEDCVGDFIQLSVAPAVQNAMIYKAVLLNKELESRCEEHLEMLDPFDPSSLERAEQRLVALGAVDAEDGRLTPEGKALLRIGIDLRLGRFLIACARFGCLATGVNLTSVLISADAPERLLPNHHKHAVTERMKALIDPSGDHLTLLKIFEAYETACHESRSMRWCMEMGFAHDVFVDAEASREYLLKVLDGLRFPLVDDREVTASFDEKRTRVRRALCAAFYDQLARPRMPKTATKGFARVLNEAACQQVQENAEVFANRTQANSQSSPTLGQVQPQATNEPAVRLGNNSTMWLPEVASALDSPQEMVVFGSLILTDSSTQCDPTVTLLTHVSADDVKAGASDWCRLVEFDALTESSARKNIVLDIADSLAKSFVANGGAWLKKLQHKFGSTFVATIRKNKLYATCPRQRHALIENDLRKHIHAVEPESVVIRLPEHVSMGKLIGKGGQQIAELRKCVEELLSSEDCGAGHEHVRSHVLAVDTAQKTITVTLQGASKPMMSVVVSRVQSAIMDMLGAERLPLTLDASGERGQQMQKCPRLAQLLNQTPPTAWKTRDDVMLQLAHALVWKGNASIHGGFLRDWVVRGESANDIDVQLTPPSTTEASLEEWLTTFLAETPGAAAKALMIASKRMKGAALALTINGNGLETPIDVDLVDRKNLTTVAPPGVDCDAGNLLLNRSESLRKKILSVEGSLGAALDNTLQKRFVFFYPLESGPHQSMSVMRLKRYLARGWTCLSEVPQSVQTQFLTENERALICPVASES